jgi:uncharacterized protein (TIGR02145 family)
VALRWTISNLCNSSSDDVVIIIPETVTTVVDVTNPITGKTWMDRNLGASRVAISSTDALAYGDIYEWGRLSDGHQCRTSSQTSVKSTTDIPGHANSIIGGTSAPYDWRSPQNNNLWQGLDGINNPCPSGYRLPTSAEWTAESASWSPKTSAGAFASPLRITLGGSRDPYFSGAVAAAGTLGTYWSSTISGTFSWLYRIDGTTSGTYLFSAQRATGASVRCIKN